MISDMVTIPYTIIKNGIGVLSPVDHLRDLDGEKKMNFFHFFFIFLSKTPLLMAITITWLVIFREPCSINNRTYLLVKIR